MVSRILAGDKVRKPLSSYISSVIIDPPKLPIYGPNSCIAKNYDYFIDSKFYNYKSKFGDSLNGVIFNKQNKNYISEDLSTEKIEKFLVYKDKNRDKFKALISSAKPNKTADFINSLFNYHKENPFIPVLSGNKLHFVSKCNDSVMLVGVSDKRHLGWLDLVNNAHPAVLETVASMDKPILHEFDNNMYKISVIFHKENKTLPIGIQAELLG